MLIMLIFFLFSCFFCVFVPLWLIKKKLYS